MTNRYLRWGANDIGGLGSMGLSAVLTEIDERGAVLREIGIGMDGAVRYRSPSKLPVRGYERGLFDDALVAETDADEMSAAEFEALWSGGR